MSDFSPINDLNTEKLLLHACCGPCSIEPARSLSERNTTFSLYYANSNIGPDNEYARRLDTIEYWTSANNFHFVEGSYEPNTWDAIIPEELKRPLDDDALRSNRCRLCYRQRFGETAEYASKNGYTAIGTTLTISPYQFHDIIRDELYKAASNYDLKCAFENYSPFYRAATQKSRELGMYRQNYCGCIYSKSEAESQRQARKAKRAIQKATIC